MRIARIEIENFRNFQRLDIQLGDQIVVIGENKIGKTNFLHALRLVLDPSVPDAARNLQETDFWDGLPRPLKVEDSIRISVELTDFEENDDLLALLCECITSPEPMTARLTYVFRPKPGVDGTPKEKDYEFFVYGGNREDNRTGYEIRKNMPLEVLAALRDAEGDLAVWTKSPLKPLLNRAVEGIEPEELKRIADEVNKAGEAVIENDRIQEIASQIQARLSGMVGDIHGLETALGISPTDPHRLIRSLRLLIDGGKRGIGDASLGSANLVLLALKTLETKCQAEEGMRAHTFLAIEEPEAHLHPHLQRLVYRDFLKPRNKLEESGEDVALPQTVILTTHSPHIASVAPLRSLVLLKPSADGGSTTAVSTAAIDLKDEEVDDLERYLDVNRGEILFAKGVILVEGDSERFIVPTLAKILDYDLDTYGITVCSVSGTNFTPFVKLLGPNGLNIPFAVLTDRDPQPDKPPLGETRVQSLLSELIPPEDEWFVKPTEEELLAIAPDYGLFLNHYTLEVDVFHAEHHEVMCKTLISLTDNKAAIERANGWIASPGSIDEKRFLADVSEIGKGRYAQALAGRLKDGPCPEYIEKGIKFVISRCN